ncbi:MAG: exosortase K [Flavobacteriales bacterium]|nr:exosortase K [Flavobacteriales bacterium]
MIDRQRLKTLLMGGALLAGAFALKWWYRTATIDELDLLLSPVARMVALLGNTSYELVAGKGYYFPDLNMVIDRSCSGTNFMVIATASFAFLVLKSRNGGCMRPLLALLMLPAAYALTLLTNTGRILCMVALQRVGRAPSALAHEVIGAAIFLTALVLATLLLDRLTHRTTPPCVPFAIP